MNQHTCARGARGQRQEQPGHLCNGVQYCTLGGEVHACDEAMRLRRSAASSVSESFSQSGRLPQRAMTKKKHCPSARTLQASSPNLKEPHCDGHGRRPDMRGLKRLHGDLEQPDVLPNSAQRPCGFTLTSPVMRGGTVNEVQARPAKTAGPCYVLAGGELPEIPISTDFQCGTFPALPAAIPGYTPHAFDSDAAEKEAEIRAEVLDGVRQLLQDNSEIDCLVQLCMRLREKKTALLERAIHRRGIAECMELLEETLRVEANGGMLTAEGRRRTPGGVFLRLLQDRIPREDKRFIWDEQNREQRRLKRDRIRAQNAERKPKLLRSHRNSERPNCAPLAVEQRLVADPASEEREPGELDADAVEALSSSWT